MFSHHCIKPSCGNSYQDDEQDAYYCPACLAEKKRIAQEFDAKFNTTGQVPSGALAAYDAARGNKAFPLAASLGLKI